MSKKWPFGADADEHDPLTAHRIPVTSSHPSWLYVIAFDRESEARPTDAEVRMLVSYLNENISRYGSRSSYALTSRTVRPLDVDAGTNTVIFHKHGEDDWSYRRASWQHGFTPTHWKEWDGSELKETGRVTWYNGTETFHHSLEQIMDEAHYCGKRDEAGKAVPSKSWLKWKADHPEAFPALEPAR